MAIGVRTFVKLFLVASFFEDETRGRWAQLFQDRRLLGVEIVPMRRTTLHFCRLEFVVHLLLLGW